MEYLYSGKEGILLGHQKVKVSEMLENDELILLDSLTSL